ncbi:MAG: hypothetical protein RLZ98_42 [Pseudomonadota bacterium]|jgi:ATP-dependent helicase/nuclease subunit A
MTEVLAKSMGAGGDLYRETVEAQLKVSDPRASAWVSANAGAGKTHVLKTRVLRLLLSGTPPDQILCLTYTKSAAAEMSARVFSDLAEWATADDEALAAALEKVLGCLPEADEKEAARRLFARAIETPGGLKVQTIHGFCERLLQRFPLEAGVPPGFTILDDEMTGELRREAIDRVLGEAVREPGSELGAALHTMIAFAAEDGFDEVLVQAIGSRQWLEGIVRLAPPDEDAVAAIEGHYRRIFCVRNDVTIESLQDDIAGLIPQGFLEQAAGILSGGGKTDQEIARRLLEARHAKSRPECVVALEAGLLTQQKLARSDSRFVTKAIRTAHPEIVDPLVRARDACERLVRERQGLIVIGATLALVRLAERVLQGYSEAKARRAALDFDDLIMHTAHLLEGASAAQWVLYKLDGGLQHILVDEAQDTSPLQWTIVDHLAREFFAGTGASEKVRTLFAVGDEKQSIYSFQGAAPKMFADAGARFKELARLAGMDLCSVPLTLSFRTVKTVLEAVDDVFADPRRTPGLTAGAEAVCHHARRIGQAGLVEIWPTFKHEAVEDGDLWQPVEEAAARSPANALANKIAETIDGWLKSGEMIVSENRPITAGDILILVRKRYPFAEPMVAALKARKIAVAGADRMMLADQVVVQDLLALADFLTLPEDDLALATVLKSPMFGLNDDDLLELAPKRKGMLWSTLLGAAARTLRYGEAADRLKRWRAQSDIKPPFEFFASLLDRDGMRARFLKRLGLEAVDPIDEFLSLAIAFDDRATPSLTGFVDYVRKARRELKRDMEHGRNEVRVMTVHGAKGLEAPVVFLPDTCAAGRARGAALLDIGAVDGLAEPMGLRAWPVKGSGLIEVVERARSHVATAEAEERNRLLYVAMTRARDRLYIAGFENKKGREKGCWYDVISEALDGRLEKVETGGGEVLRLSGQQTAEFETPRVETRGHLPSVALPEWATRPAPAETQVTIPLAPSRLAPLEFDETGDPAEPLPLERSDPSEARNLSPLMLSRDAGLLRGIITHALLEYLPGVPPSERRSVAEGYVEVRGAPLRRAIRDSIVGETLAVLETPGFGDLFGPGARAEVPIVANVARPAGQSGAPLRITGQIDRLLVTPDTVLIADYKTNRSAPATLQSVAPAYLYQLAAYRLAVQQIFPGKTMRAAILWTETPSLMETPGSVLDSYEACLWQLDRARLDAIADGT